MANIPRWRRSAGHLRRWLSLRISEHPPHTWSRVFSWWGSWLLLASVVLTWPRLRHFADHHSGAVTAAAALAAVSYVLLTRRLVEETRQLVQTADEQIMASTRPIITFKISPAIPGPPGAFAIQVTNDGSGVALNVHVKVRRGVYKLEALDPPTRPIEGRHGIIMLYELGALTAKSKSPLLRFLSVDPEASAEDAPDHWIRGQRTFRMAVVTAQYSDIHRRSLWTEAEIVWRGESGLCVMDSMTIDDPVARRLAQEGMDNGLVW
jgi:hypothetical protein